MNIFNPSIIYETLFVDVKAVLKYPNIKELELNDRVLFDNWKYISSTKYSSPIYFDSVYLEKAVYHPEYLNIVAITYGTVNSDDTGIKRNIGKIVHSNEVDILREVINLLSSFGSSKNYIFCGHGITYFDIPLLVKRIIKNRKELSGIIPNSIEIIPPILKNYLNSKPWDNLALDIATFWKMNGFEGSSMNLISDFLNLKKVDTVYTGKEISDYYWDTITEDPQKTIDFIVKQSLNETNLAIQFVNELRLI